MTFLTLPTDNFVNEADDAPIANMQILACACWAFNPHRLPFDTPFCELFAPLGRVAYCFETPSTTILKQNALRSACPFFIKSETSVI